MRIVTLDFLFSDVQNKAHHEHILRYIKADYTIISTFTNQDRVFFVLLYPFEK
jgi:hypothetical protein